MFFGCRSATSPNTYASERVIGRDGLRLVFCLEAVSCEGKPEHQRTSLARDCDVLVSGVSSAMWPSSRSREPTQFRLRICTPRKKKKKNKKKEGAKKKAKEE